MHTPMEDLTSRYEQQCSERNSDRFHPQDIQPITKAISPKKDSSYSIQFSIQSRKESEVQRSLFRRKDFRTKEIIKVQSNAPLIAEAARLSSANNLIKFIFQKKLLERFVKTLIQKSYLRPININTHGQYLLQENYLSQKVKNKQQVSSQTTPSIPLLNPTGSFIYLWSILKLFQLLIVAFWIPFQTCYLKNIKEGSGVEYGLLIFFFLDLIIKLNKGIIDQGQMVQSRQMILINYCKQELLNDLINIVTLLMVLYSEAIQTMVIVEILVFVQFAISVKKFHSILLNYQETLDIQNSHQELVQLVELVFLIVFFAHIMACIWYYVADRSLEIYQTNWIHYHELTHQNVLTLYCYSFYWATMTMVTVGYGDITAKNPLEVVCSIVLMFVASVIFAYSINSIGNILNNLNVQHQAYQKKLLLINSYMKCNNVSYELQSRVRNYLKFYLQEELNGSQNELNIILESLSENLRLELVNDVQSKLIRKCSFFTGNFSGSLMDSVSSELEKKSFVPGEIIFRQHHQDQSSLYIIQKGSVQIVEENSGKILKVFKEGESFGEAEFLAGSKRRFSAYSRSFSQIFCIPRETFISMLKNFPEDFEAFCQVKDEFQSNNLTSLKVLNCYACDSSHYFLSCPTIRFLPDLEKLAMRENFMSQKRNRKFERYRKEKYKARLNMMANQNRCLSFQERLKVATMVHIEEKTSSRLLEERFQSQNSERAQTPNQVKEGGKLPTIIQSPMAGRFIEEAHTPTIQVVDIGEGSQQVRTSKRRIHSTRMMQGYKSENAVQSGQDLLRDDTKVVGLEDLEGGQFQVCDIDQFYEFKNYFKQNNLSQVIKGYNRYLQSSKAPHFGSRPKSLYSFYKYQPRSKKLQGKRHIQQIKFVQSLQLLE